MSLSARFRRFAVAPVERPGRESPIVRALRAARGLRRFVGLLGEAANALLARRRIDTDVDGLDPGTAAIFNDLVSQIDWPDRAQITQFEKPFPREAQLIENMARLTVRAVVAAYHAERAECAEAPARRDQHSKPHGCVRARFIVRDDIPEDYAVGVFKRGATYDAILRFSNASIHVQSDKLPDSRGLSIKLLNLPTPTLLSKRLHGRPREQDFICASFPVFFCADVVDYIEFMQATLFPSARLDQRLVRLAKIIKFSVTHPRQIVLLFRLAIQRTSDPLLTEYHSMAPFALGKDKVVRYLVTPASNMTPPTRRTSSPNYLREALAADLAPAGTATPPRVLVFSVQRRHAPRPVDVENATLRWTDPLDRTVPLARIEIPPQDFQTPQTEWESEHLSFHPWNSLDEHRPLGSLNRMRLGIYLASCAARRRLNMQRGL